eukprot:5324541-Pleurochrysis_carterae.AAC.2
MAQQCPNIAAMWTSRYAPKRAISLASDSRTFLYWATLPTISPASAFGNRGARRTEGGSND